MKNLRIIFLITLFLFFNTEAFAAKNLPQKTTLELRDVQTRLFDAPNHMSVVKAVINTLQDNGFIIQDMEPDLGYIRAKKEVKLKRTNKGRVTAYSSLFALDTACLALSFGLNPAAAWGMFQTSMMIKNEVAPHTVIFDSNINIENLGKKTKVRFTVIEKILENGDGYTTVKSSPRKVVRHYEPEIYQEFFNQVNKNLFIENNL